MEDAYLRRVLGDVLVEGLRDTALADPADPIDYLAKWLLNHQAVEDQWTRFREEQKNIAQQKAEYLANLEAEMRRLEAERRARQEEEQRLAEQQAQLEKEAAERAKAAEEEEEEKEKPTESTEPPAEPNEDTTVYSEELNETF
jgi:predicted phage tail protein